MNQNPVLLVHGFWRKQNVFKPMSKYLKDLGYQVHSFDLTIEKKQLGLEVFALQLADYIQKNLSRSQSINLVGLSMGGLVSRYYIQRLEGVKKVEKFITISSPHKGTFMAYFLPDKTCIQMRPNSSFLQDLNQDIAMLEQIKFTSIWTEYDFLIVPANSSLLGVGKEIKLPVFTHAMMVKDQKTMTTIAKIIAN